MLSNLEELPEITRTSFKGGKAGPAQLRDTHEEYEEKREGKEVLLTGKEMKFLEKTKQT